MPRSEPPSPKARHQLGLKWHELRDAETQIKTQQTELILEAHQNGWTQIQIAESTGLSQQRVSWILKKARTTNNN